MEVNWDPILLKTIGCFPLKFQELNDQELNSTNIFCDAYFSSFGIIGLLLLD